MSLGASFENVEKNNLTGLHIAAQSATNEVLKFLIETLPKEFLFIKNKHGRTALEHAKLVNEESKIKILEKACEEYKPTNINADQALKELLEEEELEQ